MTGGATSLLCTCWGIHRAVPRDLDSKARTITRNARWRGRGLFDRGDRGLGGGDCRRAQECRCRAMVRDTATAFAIVLRCPDAGERPSNLAEDGSSGTRLRYDADAEVGGVIPHPRPGR